MEQALERNGAGIPIRELGRTGLKVSLVGSLSAGFFMRRRQLCHQLVRPSAFLAHAK